MLENFELKKEILILADAELKASFVPDKDIVILIHQIYYLIKIMLMLYKL